MYEFDTYINTIIGGLKISKEKKEELADEFRDHLESLKSEFIKDGFSESESIKRAIERFGESNEIKKKLHKSLFSFRNSGNVIFGAVITLIVIIFSFIPVAGVTVDFRDYSPAAGAEPVVFIYRWSVGICILFFIPIGYFLPVILNRVLKVLQSALIFSALGILIGVCYNIALANSLDVGFLLAYIASGLLGGMTGYVMLIAVNKLNTVRKNERLTRFFEN